MSRTALQCGVRFQPPSVILIYRDNDKTRRRIIPVRNFSQSSDCGVAAEQLKNNPRHKAYLEGVSLCQLKKLHVLLRGHLRGESLAESLGKIEQEQNIDPEEDMNKLDDEELAKRKRIMDELFEKNRKKKDDPDFVYDIEVEFPQDEQLESCGWDGESCEEV
ncbi:centrosomal protein of 19 kDa [Coturnix japonica]|uniref:centrosomal protein of 19 kDa n=1 Tax=Coturnix japonica TaxID=93934 RepID=UPI0007780552|nr:centrosomal protein of 19 kDa [Coturnix japonica]